MEKRAAAQRFEDLVVWQKAHALVLCKSAASLSANIAEGFTRRGSSDKARLMNVAQA